MSNEKKLTVRLPEELLYALRERALKERRSLNSEIVFALNLHAGERIAWHMPEDEGPHQEVKP